MFEGFTKETSEFLWELGFHNERPWFEAHREQYERSLNRPFRALAQDSWRLLSEADGAHSWGVHISRIYRDARRLFGRGPYKDHLWFSLYAADKDEGPSFWFELSAARFSCGLGFWSTKPGLMAALRRAIDANPARFERLAAEVEAIPGIKLQGEVYKRPKGDHGGRIDAWYNRKYVMLEHAGDFGEALCTPELPQRLVALYEKLLPMYGYLLEVYEESRKEVRG